MGGTIEGSQWAELLASSNQAVRGSDLRLPRPDVLLGRELIRGGLTPLALCYLRVRCAKSDVERLLGLFDCYELLVKVSVSVLLAERWGSEPAEVARRRAEFLRRPSLGQWVSALRSLLPS